MQRFRQAWLVAHGSESGELGGPALDAERTAAAFDLEGAVSGEVGRHEEGMVIGRPSEDFPAGDPGGVGGSAKAAVVIWL
jgi:hypothetical protein